MNKLESDKLMGNLNEDYAKCIIEECFEGCNKLIKLDMFHPMDFYCGNKFFEVKSRNFNYNRYRTTMVGKNKIDWIKASSSLIEVYFIFIFEDGNYYYKYNKDDEFETAIGGRRDRGYNEIKYYYYIPIDKLIKF